MTHSRILMIVLIAAAVCVMSAGMAASEPTEQWNKTLGGKSNDDWLIKFSGESNDTQLVETLAKDTWNYLKTFNENHLPFNWYRIDTNESGRYFNPAEVGFFALSPILSYDMGLDCDGDGIFEPKNASLQKDDWDYSINRTSSTLNRIEALSTYQQSAHDIWKLGDNEAPPNYSPAAFDEFNQTKPFNPHYYISTNISDFPKEINDGDFTQIFIHFNLTKEEADNEQLLFLDTLDTTHGNVHYFNLRIKVGQSVNNLSYLGEYKFGSDGSYPEERYVAVPEKYLKSGENVLLLENANPPWSGHWLVWDSLRFGQIKKAYYQWYDTNGHIGLGQTDRLVPSIDNAWLVASLITIREYARANGEYNLANQSDNILKGIDFTMWYNYTDHRFFWGDIDDPKNGAVAAYYSDENRIINILAFALGQINQSEFQASLDALNQQNGSYGNITVDKVNLDGSYFTYASPALFIREKDTPYAQTLENATWAQIKYAEDKGYPCWGISDGISPINPNDYLNLGVPPVAGSYNDLGILTPHTSALALVNKNPELLDRAIANFRCLENYGDLYDPRYGFRDSVNVSDNVTSTKFLTLDQEWIFLSLANYKNNTIWKYFYMDNGVRKAHKEMYGAATWIVDDSGGADYTKIQDAIDYAIPGDIILVYSGKYFENVVVNKQLELRGQDNGNGMPVVNVMGTGNAIKITANGVILNGFNVKNSHSYDGITIVSSNNVIRNNNASNNSCGIVLSSSGNNTVSGNNVSNNKFGIRLMYSSNNNTIYHNNLIDNTQNAYDSCTNQWDSGSEGNYYSDYTGTDSNGDGIGDTPYNISGGAGAQDRYPLMQPWNEGGSELISIGSANAPTNSTVTIPVSVANVTNISRISFDLLYNSSVLTVSSISANESFVGSSITPNIDNVNGTTSIVLTNSNLISALTETPVIDIAFNVIGGSRSSTSLDLQNVEFSDVNSNPYTPAVVVDGQITVGIKGDFNGNGRVDIGDVAKVAFMVAGKVPEDLNADFNGNGRVDIGDAAKIAFYLAGKVSEL